MGRVHAGPDAGGLLLRLRHHAADRRQARRALRRQARLRPQPRGHGNPLPPLSSRRQGRRTDDSDSEMRGVLAAFNLNS